MNPRRSGHHVKVGVAPNSLAMSSTILFSKPSNRSFEYGRLFGSAQTRKLARDPWASAPVSSSREAPTASATEVGELRELLVRADRAEPFAVSFEARRQSDTRPASDAGQDRYVLLAIRPHVRHGVADDAGRRLELPQLPTGSGVHRLHVPLERAVKRDVTRGDE